MQLPGIAVYTGSDATIGDTGSNGAQEGVGGGYPAQPTKSTKTPTSSSTKSAAPVEYQKGGMFAQTSGTDPVVSGTGMPSAPPSSTSSTTPETGSTKSEEGEPDGTGLYSSSQSEDEEPVPAKPYHTCESASRPYRSSGQRTGEPVSDPSGQFPTNVKNFAAIPQETGMLSATTDDDEDAEDMESMEDEDDHEEIDPTNTALEPGPSFRTGAGGDTISRKQGSGRHAQASDAPSRGKWQSPGNPSSDSSQDVVTVTVTIYSSAPTAHLAGSENRQEPTSDEGETEDMSAQEAAGEQTTPAVPNEEMPLSARSLESQPLESRGGLQHAQVAARYGSRRLGWWLR